MNTKTNSHKGHKTMADYIREAAANGGVLRSNHLDAAPVATGEIGKGHDLGQNYPMDTDKDFSARMTAKANGERLSAKIAEVCPRCVNVGGHVKVSDATKEAENLWNEYMAMSKAQRAWVDNAAMLKDVHKKIVAAGLELSASLDAAPVTGDAANADR